MNSFNWQQLVHSLAIYEEKLIALQRLRAELMEVSDEETQLDLTAGIADIRNQLYVAQKQCREMITSDQHALSGLGKTFDEDLIDKMEVEEEFTPLKCDMMELMQVDEEMAQVKAEVLDQSYHEIKHVEQL